MQKLWRFLWSEKGRELIRYGVIGVATTVVSFGTLWLFVNAARLDANLSNVLSIVCAVLFAYAANKLFVFRSHCGTRAALVREAVSFFAARGIAMLVEAGGFSLLYELCRVPYMVSKLVISVVVLVLNYVLSKLVVFRKKA